jgi:hypothetical protein
MPKLESHIGRPVKYEPPLTLQRGGVAKALIGEIVDEVWADESQRDPPAHDHDKPDCWGDYAFCSQLIKWQDGTYSIRLAYYRRACKSERWRFASQTTVEYWPSIIKLLLEPTLAKKEWFEGPGKAPQPN